MCGSVITLRGACKGTGVSAHSPVPLYLCHKIDFTEPVPMPELLPHMDVVWLIGHRNTAHGELSAFLKKNIRTRDERGLCRFTPSEVESLTRIGIQTMLTHECQNTASVYKLNPLSIAKRYVDNYDKVLAHDSSRSQAKIQEKAQEGIRRAMLQRLKATRDALVSGASIRAAAALLGKSKSTIQSHKNTLTRRLGVGWLERMKAKKQASQTVPTSPIHQHGTVTHDLRITPEQEDDLSNTRLGGWQLRLRKLLHPQQYAEEERELWLHIARRRFAYALPGYKPSPLELLLARSHRCKSC